MAMEQEYYLLVLLGIRDGKTIVKMCPDIGKSQRIVNDYIKYGVKEGHVTGDYGPTGRKMKHGTRRLTEAGKKYLRKLGIKQTEADDGQTSSGNDQPELAVRSADNPGKDSSA